MGIPGVSCRISALLALLLAWSPITAMSPELDVAVVTVPGVGPYGEVVAGIGDMGAKVRVLDARQEERTRAELMKFPPDIMVAVGSDAARLLDRLFPPPATVVSTVVFSRDIQQLNSRGRTRAAVRMDLPPAPVAAEIKHLFAGRTRIAVIQGPMQTEEYMQSLKDGFQKAGLQLLVLHCLQARDLVATFLRAREHADFVWCLPDPDLYTSATLKPLLIASLTNRLPLIGFSEEFVAAGALFGASPDYRELGRQTAQVAGRLVRAETVPAVNDVVHIHFAYNMRVARLIGIKAELGGEANPNLRIIR